MDYLEIAHEVLAKEIDGIREVQCKLNSSFNDIINVISNSSGRVVMCGMGKSGHIAKKICATLVSTGTPSLYLHPAEAFHGDLGMVKPKDIFIAISNSGETSEVMQLVPYIRDNGNTLISMTGNPKSSLAQSSNFHINIGVSLEACPLNLAPTTSTTASLAVGDAIAVALMSAAEFKEENFARYHPGGSLGRKLLMTVNDFSYPATFIEENATFIEVVASLSSSGCGVVLIGNDNDLKGIITDGDLKQILKENGSEAVFRLSARDIMSFPPKAVAHNTRCADADAKMSSLGINSLVICDGDAVCGIYQNLNRRNI